MRFRAARDEWKQNKEDVVMVEHLLACWQPSKLERAQLPETEYNRSNDLSVFELAPLCQTRGVRFSI
jgi:hypothetical protein